MPVSAYGTYLITEDLGKSGIFCLISLLCSIAIVSPQKQLDHLQLLEVLRNKLKKCSKGNHREHFRRFRHLIAVSHTQ
jgi:hypothetical protein